METKAPTKPNRKKRGDDKEKKENPFNTTLIKALRNLKSMIEHLGEDLFSPEILKWLKAWKGKTLKDINEFKIDTLDGKVVLGKGRLKLGKGKGKGNKVKTAVEVDNVIIVILKGGKKGKQAVTLRPQKKGDTIVILIDKADVDTDELQMKIVLFHEFVHVKQLRDPKSGFAEIRDSDATDEEKAKKNQDLGLNFEAEAHLATVFICTLLLQKHPEGAKAILGKNKTARKQLENFLAKVKDPLKLLNQILATKDKLKKEIKEENEALNKKSKELKKLHEQFKKKLDRYKKSLPQNKDADKIAKQLDKLAKRIEDAGKAISEFESKKTTLFEFDAELAKKLQEIARMLGERQKKAEQRKKETDKERRKTLKKEIKELDKKIKKLGKKIKKDLDKEVKDLEKIAGKAGAALTNIKKLIGEIAKALGKSFDHGLIDAFAKLLACLRKTATVLAKLKVKLIVLRDLEALVKKLIKKLT